MLNRKFLTVCLLLLLMPLFSFVGPLSVQAAAPAITIAPIQMNENNNTDFCFGWISDYTLGYDDENDTYGNSILAVGFEDNADPNYAFNLEGLTADEVTLYVGSDDCGSSGTPEVRVGEATIDNQDNGHDNVTFGTAGTATIYKTVTILLDMYDGEGTSTFFEIADTTPISIGIQAVTGNSVLTPPISGNYKTVVEQVIWLDWGQPAPIDFIDTQFLYVCDSVTGCANEVNITATLDPSISLALTNNDCSVGFVDGLGTLVTNAIKTCGFTATAVTNIGTGYTGYIEQDHPFQTTVNGVTHPIPGPAGVVVEGADALTGFGEYGIGIQTDDNTSWPEFTGTCASYDGLTTDLPAKAITGDNERNIFAEYTAALNGIAHGVTKFCAGARITYETPPGTYTHTVTITVVGNF